ncbi:c-type cytochrome [Sphingomonas parva]|uniref:C-type cytochrome n=1 Tax=Sphingomonas parva TaxID=2555898 RepID=A0A4Y8ZVW8_9SPHN|nr:c-type cytochrome [Sphingomonas parva]TFI59275.1 c-type cytochrome [Sphingomonas parva]
MRAAALAGAAVMLLALGAAAAPQGDATRGERAYQKCYACHAVEPGRNDLSGPTLHAIVERPIATEKGFAYSPALKALAVQNGRWDPELLDRFIADPDAIAPGTAMSYPGMKNPIERTDLLAYLAALRAER